LAPKKLFSSSSFFFVLFNLLPSKLQKMDAPSDLGIEAPKQPKNCFFPFSKFGSKQRRFNVAWYADREWLEYSKAKDAAFCYCCRKFSSRSGCESDVFTIAGYKDWTSALESKKGFARHVGSMQHKQHEKLEDPRDRNEDQFYYLEAAGA